MDATAEPTGTHAIDVGRAAARLYARAPGIVGVLQRHRHRIAPLGEVLRLVPAGASVLDIGCGGGLLLNVLADAGLIRDGLGIDSAPAAIDAARSAADGLRDGRPRPRFELRSVQEGLPEGAFDAVLLVDVLHHVPPADQESAFRAAAARVAPGGILLWKDMCARPRWRAAMNRLHDLAMARQWIHHVPADAVDRWAASLGLARMHAARRNVLWYGHELRAYRKGAGP